MAIRVKNKLGFLVFTEVVRALQFASCAVCLGMAATLTSRSQSIATFPQDNIVNCSIVFGMVAGAIGALFAFLMLLLGTNEKMSRTVPAVKDLVLSTTCSIMFLAMGTVAAAAQRDNNIPHLFGHTNGAATNSDDLYEVMKDLGFLNFVLFGGTAILAAMEVKERAAGYEDVLPMSSYEGIRHGSVAGAPHAAALDLHTAEMDQDSVPVELKVTYKNNLGGKM